MDATQTRKTAVRLYVLAAVLFLAALYAGLVYHGDIDPGAEAVTQLDFFVWVLLFGVALALILLVLVYLYFRVPGAKRAEPNALDVTCKNCSHAFRLADTGERPLYFVCPECGVEDVLPAAEGGYSPLEAQATPDSEEVLLVKCSNCNNVFELPFTEARPVIGDCPNCGRRGILPPTLPEGAQGEPLIDLEGIGPTYAEKLAEAGINNSEQLRLADVDVLVDVTGIARGHLESWQAMADLIRIKGIGPQYAEVLARSGIKGVQDLARQEPKALASLIQGYLESLEASVMGTGVDEARARAWVRAAKQVAKTGH